MGLSWRIGEGGPQGGNAEKERGEATGMYVMPGFIDMHEHVGSSPATPGGLER
jgi:imidazolonepropionase-like amidohydrolase